MAPVAAECSDLDELMLSPGDRFVVKPRQFVPDMWSVDRPDTAQGRHVLLLDDTWTTGAHAQSAAAALRRAEARAVTVLVIARWLDPSWSPTAVFLRDLVTRDYDVYRCPVSAGCPQ